MISSLSSAIHRDNQLRKELLEIIEALEKRIQALEDRNQEMKCQLNRIFREGGPL